MDNISTSKESPPPSHATTPQTTTTAAKQQQSEADMFEQLSRYQFTSDREFAHGLAIILGHPDTPASEEEISRHDNLVLQAKCFFFARKKNLASPLNVATYKSWLEGRPAPDASVNQASVTESREAGLSSSSLPSISGDAGQQSIPASQEPAYPTSFAHIVELITTGQPVSGIQEIPDTLLTGQGAPSAKPKRRKPWEKEKAPEAS